MRSRFAVQWFEGDTWMQYGLYSTWDGAHVGRCALRAVLGAGGRIRIAELRA